MTKYSPICEKTYPQNASVKKSLTPSSEIFTTFLHFLPCQTNKKARYCLLKSLFSCDSSVQAPVCCPHCSPSGKPGPGQEQSALGPPLEKEETVDICSNKYTISRGLV